MITKRNVTPRRLKPENIVNTLRENLCNPAKYFPILSLLFFGEIVICIVVINYRKYTEIDWKAYMQECEGFLNGTKDYFKLEGGTGPLVYPAGFVYFFSALYYATSHGANIRFAQYIFAVFYLLNLLLVFNIYRKCLKVPPYAYIFMCCMSYRIHSVFILRLFNDPVAMLFLYSAVNLFLHSRWTLGCFVYSLAVSIKMNILLMSPGLLFVLLNVHGTRKTIRLISLCAALQLILGAPFLLVNPVAYIVRSFDLGRQFFFKWTVNWRFLPESTFHDRKFHVALMLLHVSVLFAFYYFRWSREQTAKNNMPIYKKLAIARGEVHSMLPNDLIFPLFLSNFIGICFCRSLHYQFYVWYFHTLPYLLWSTNLSNVLRLLILGVLEMCWSTYPSTNLSSLSLHFVHLTMLLFIWTGSGNRKLAQIGQVKWK